MPNMALTIALLPLFMASQTLVPHCPKLRKVYEDHTTCALPRRSRDAKLADAFRTLCEAGELNAFSKSDLAKAGGIDRKTLIRYCTGAFGSILEAEAALKKIKAYLAQRIAERQAKLDIALRRLNGHV